MEWLRETTPMQRCENNTEGIPPISIPAKSVNGSSSSFEFAIFFREYQYLPIRKFPTRETRSAKCTRGPPTPPPPGFSSLQESIFPKPIKFPEVSRHFCDVIIDWNRTKVSPRIRDPVIESPRRNPRIPSPGPYLSLLQAESGGKSRRPISHISDRP